jgi:multimeric flavodoxin WrbA
MKILAINGSPRGKAGYTQFLINTLFEGAERAGAHCETLELSSYAITPCAGCHACQKKEHYLKCIYAEKDDVSMLFDRMRAADILIYATPIYIFTMTGLMKTFLDRIASTGDSSLPALSGSGLFFHHIDKKLLSKPFVLLTCQDNFESETSKNVISYFQSFSHFHDAPLVGILTRTSGALAGHGKNPEKEKNYPKIIQAHEAFRKAGKELAQNGTISRSTQKIAAQPIIPIPKIIHFLLRFHFIRRNRRFMNILLQKAKKSS